MKREMRRKDRSTTTVEAEELLRRADYGFLGLAGRDLEPYVVPLNHVYVDGYIAFHCAREGHKLDIIRENPRVSYAVCTEAEVQPEELSTKYRSAIAFGRAEVVDEPEAKKALLAALVKRLAPGHEGSCGDESSEHTCVVRIKVERLTGKGGD